MSGGESDDYSDQQDLRRWRSHRHRSMRTMWFYINSGLLNRLPEAGQNLALGHPCALYPFKIKRVFFFKKMRKYKIYIRTRVIVKIME